MDMVTLRHPSGKFSVTVAATRADVLRSRGYSATVTDTSSAPAEVTETSKRPRTTKTTGGGQ